MRLLVCGGRDYEGPVKDFLTNWWLDNTADSEGNGAEIVVITGGCPTGADQLARWWAEMQGMHYVTVPALWKRHGKAAGPLRNEAMLLLQPDVVIAFPGGKGTEDMVRRAEKAGIPVVRA